MSAIPIRLGRKKNNCCFLVKRKIRGNLDFDTCLDIIYVSATVSRSLFGIRGISVCSGRNTNQKKHRNANIRLSNTSRKHEMCLPSMEALPHGLKLGLDISSPKLQHHKRSDGRSTLELDFSPRSIIKRYDDEDVPFVHIEQEDPTVD